MIFAEQMLNRSCLVKNKEKYCINVECELFPLSAGKTIFKAKLPA